MEKEKLIEPLRNDKNGYRDYSEKDIETIKKIVYLRTLEISIEDIRGIIFEKVSLVEIIEKQTATIQTQIEGLNKVKFIFIYPLACIIIRILLRPSIYVRYLMNYFHGELISEYLTNYICFIALSVEIFSILFIYGLVKSVVIVLFVDTVVLIGILIVGITKLGFIQNSMANGR